MKKDSLESELTPEQFEIMLSSSAHVLGISSVFMTMFAKLLKDRFYSPTKRAWVSKNRELMYDMVLATIAEAKQYEAQLKKEKQFW